MCGVISMKSRKMFNRVIGALLSTIVVSTILSIKAYNPISERKPNTGYETFTSYFIIFMIFVGVAYLLGGIIFSYIIDTFIENKWLKFIYYLMAGFIVGVLSIIVFILFLSGPMEDNKTVLYFGMYGSLGAGIFYIILSLLNRKFSN